MYPLCDHTHIWLAVSHVCVFMRLLISKCIQCTYPNDFPCRIFPTIKNYFPCSLIFHVFDMQNVVNNDTLRYVKFEYTVSLVWFVANVAAMPLPLDVPR